MTAADFNTMVVMHGDYLKPYAIALTHDHDDAKDLMQETMLKALLNKEKYQFGTNLKAWLYTIMRNTFINNYRRNKKFTTTGSENTPDIGAQQYAGAVYNAGWNNVRM